MDVFMAGYDCAGEQETCTAARYGNLKQFTLSNVVFEGKKYHFSLIFPNIKSKIKRGIHFSDACK